MAHLPNDLRYASTHEWAKLESDGRVRVGITDHAQEALGDVVYVELPEIGRTVKSGEACAVVESVKAASDIYSPVGGVISEVNSALREAPESLNQKPYEAWLFCVDPADTTELDRLLDAAGYAAQIAGEE